VGAALGLAKGAELAGAVVADRWTRMISPSLDSWADRAAMVTPVRVRAHRPGPVGGVGEGELAVVVGQAGHSQPGGGVAGLADDPGTRGTVSLVLPQPVHVGGDHGPGAGCPLRPSGLTGTVLRPPHTETP